MIRMAKQTNTTTTDSKNLVYILAYVLLILTGLLVYITEGQKNKRAKFHALQAIFLGIIIIVLGFFWFIPFVDLIDVILWLYGIYVGVIAYDGTDVSMPVLGDYAKQYS